MWQEYAPDVFTKIERPLPRRRSCPSPVKERLRRPSLSSLPALYRGPCDAFAGNRTVNIINIVNIIKKNGVLETRIK